MTKKGADNSTAMRAVRTFLTSCEVAKPFSASAGKDGREKGISGTYI